MSKYNHIHSIPIDSVPEEELTQAMKEWAEGDDSLESLLWAFYHSGIKTNGCHAGIDPYVGFNYDSTKKDIIGRILFEILSLEKSQVIIRPDGGNPFSGSDWYVPSLAIGTFVKTQAEIDSMFDFLRSTIENADIKTNHSILTLLNLLDFLINKYSNLLIRLCQNDNGIYSLSFEKSISKNDNATFDKWNQFFTSIGLVYVDTPVFIRIWEYKSSDRKEFFKKLEEISNYILQNYSFEIPNLENKNNSFNTNAHIIRNQSLESSDMKIFDSWLKKKRRYYNRRYWIGSRISKLMSLFHFKKRK